TVHDMLRRRRRNVEDPPWLRSLSGASGIFEVSNLSTSRRLEHQLHDHFAWIRRFRDHHKLARARRFGEIGDELCGLLNGYAWGFGRATHPSPPRPLKVVSWNIERGVQFEALRRTLEEDPRISGFDLLLLNEVDLGMGRSQNRDVARELADSLACDYVFANQHIVLTEGDAGEIGHGIPNNAALHGTAVLSRIPIQRFTAVPLPEYVDKLRATETRLGRKRTLIVEVEVDGTPCLIASVHLDPFAPSKHRAMQIHRIQSAVDAFGPRPCLLGGDFNTLTYDFSSPTRLAANLLTKAASIGVAGTVQHYMVPEIRFERPVFEALSRLRFEISGFNDRRGGTLFFDANDPGTRARASRYMPTPIYDRMCRLTKPWGGRVPMRADWFAGRHLQPSSAKVVSLPRDPHTRVSDHDPICVEVEPLKIPAT
ncbi:MAG: endonuclease/exonuclease/phosphatase family protein, partial [Nannocystaceae bacterium]